MPLLGPKIGFGARWLQPWASKLKKCAELTVPACDTGPTDGCCVVIPCTYCLKLVSSAGAKFYGTAHWNGTTWHGFVNGREFTAYWEKYGANCEFVVIFNAVEIYREKCYAISCRNASASDTVTIDGYAWTLSWTKVDSRPLPYVIDNKCTDHFCGNCECTCQNMCYTITTPAPDCVACTGPLPDLNNNCYGPLWQTTANCGTKSYVISLTLSRDAYGNCQIGGFFNGEDLPELSVTNCSDINAQWVAYDGTVLTVSCEACSCTAIPVCTAGCCFPYVVNATYPCGYFVDMPYSISAPGCDLNGVTGSFKGTGALTNKGTCGGCANFPGESHSTLGQEWYVPSIPLPDGSTCASTPCSITICLRLECEDNVVAPSGLSDCCGKMRLWVGTSVRMAGDVGDAPAEGSDACPYWKKVSPSSCSCLPGTAGFAGVFNVSLTIACQESFTSGPCAYKTKCCEPFCSGFTLTI